MSTIDQNKAIAVEFVDSLAKLDTDRFFSLFSKDAVIETIGNMAASARKDAAHVAKEIGLMQQIFPEGMTLNLVTMTAEDNRVLCELQGLNTTIDGQQYNNRYVFILEFSGDKISEVREYQDTALVEAVLMPAFKKRGVVANSKM